MFTRFVSLGVGTFKHDFVLDIYSLAGTFARYRQLLLAFVRGKAWLLASFDRDWWALEGLLLSSNGVQGKVVLLVEDFDHGVLFWYARFNW